MEQPTNDHPTTAPDVHPRDVPDSEGVAITAADNGPEVAARLTRALAIFGSASVVGGAALALGSGHPSVRAFGKQSVAWGAINLAIAGIGARRAAAHPATASRLRRTLLANAGLDVGYLALGAHIAYHRTTFGGRQSPEAALGNGLAIVDQALGLLALDLRHARHLRG